MLLTHWHALGLWLKLSILYVTGTPLAGLNWTYITTVPLFPA